MAQSKLMARFRKWVSGAASLVNWAVVIAGTTGVVWLLLWAAGTFHEKVPARTALPWPSSNVTTVAAELVDFPKFETAVGVIQAVHEASVASKILARVEQVPIQGGQRVAQGDLLVQLDSSDLKARLGQAESALAAADARWKQSQADFERAERLLPNASISRAEYDAAVAKLKGAIADRERASQSVDEAQIQLGYATVSSPFDGVVIDKLVEPGETATPGQVMLKLYDPAQMQLVAQVRESLALGLKVGQTIGARLDALGYDCQGTIREVVPQADAATHTFAVKVTGPCPPGLYSGMFGRIKIPVGQERVLLIPESAVRRIGQLTLVDVYQDGRVISRNVQLGRTIQDRQEVLAGLSVGERVVVTSNSEGSE